MIDEKTITELCKVQGMIAERIRAETGYDAVFVYGISSGETIQCGAVYTGGMTNGKADAIAHSARHYLNQCIPK